MTALRWSHGNIWLKADVMRPGRFVPPSPTHERIVDRRRNQRLSRVRPGKILIPKENRTVLCATRDVTAIGARLQVRQKVDTIPDAFTLELNNGRRLDCVVRWRGPNELGVEFT